jgi:arginine deiminase
MEYTEFDPAVMLRSQIEDAEREHFRLQQVLADHEADVDALPKARSKVAQASVDAERSVLDKSIEDTQEAIDAVEGRHARLVAQKAELDGVG